MTLRRGLLTSWVRDAKKCNRGAGSHLGYHEAQFPGTENRCGGGGATVSPLWDGRGPKAVNRRLLGI